MFDGWFARHTHSLVGKRVAVCGATGGIGEALCCHLARLGAELWLCCRSESKTQALIDTLRGEYPDLIAHFVPLDLEDTASVLAAADRLSQTPPHVLIHNAGAYAIPRHITAQGVDNVYAINCISPYMLTKRLMEPMASVDGRVVMVSSIAHNYSKIDVSDPDFSTRTAASKVYGNAKRHLMLALFRLFEGEERVSLSVVHPGITLTGITDHYPKWLYAIIKHPMKVVFMSPRRAALSVLKGVFASTAYGEWIGPRWFDVWGLPRKRRLHTFTRDEVEGAVAAVERLGVAVHHLNLNPDPFAFIAEGRKTIEMRLYDEKRRTIRIGDLLVFTHTEDTSRTLTAQVKALHRFPDFAALYAALPLEQCGYLPEEVATASPSDMNVYYSAERQACYGVVGIEIALVKEETR